MFSEARGFLIPYSRRSYVLKGSWKHWWQSKQLQSVTPTVIRVRIWSSEMSPKLLIFLVMRKALVV